MPERPEAASGPGLRVAVLIKQVPLVDGNNEPMKLGHDGRLERGGIELEINPFCRRAITKGIEFAAGAGGRSLVVTLGPPSAEDALREAVAAGASDAVLITDPAFAGSDTLATSRALAAVLTAEGPFDLVLAGLYSVDADTGQVAPELAELLGLPFVSGAREIELRGERLVLDCERDDGLLRAEVSLPAVVSVAERLTYPAKRDPAERAAVDAAKVAVRSAGDLGPGPWGQAGSPTEVGEVRFLESPRLGRRLEGSLAEQVEELVGALLERGVLTEGDHHLSRTPVPEPSGGAPAVLVALEPGRHRGARELLGGAALVARALGGRVVAAGAIDFDARELGADGADEVICYRSADGRPLAPEDVAHALCAYAEAEQVPVVLGPSTSWGREVCSRLAARLGAGLTGDASALEIRGGRLVAWKPAFGGQLEAAITASTRTQCATVRPGALPLLVPRAAAAVVREELLTPAGRVSYRDHRRDGESELLPAAEVLISIGAGMDPERYGEVEELRRALGAELVATRKVTDKGWLPRTRQVGLTGIHLHPRLVLGLAVAGKVNHVVGLRQAGTIVLVNTDPELPGFEAADYGVVGDWAEFVPLFLERVRPLLAASPG
ncbi:MAG TPA: FAD-binding protein [Acidimicrobiales bacterium]|nr:FAD-binding protein [Acidimicrobiales bacterium]